MLPEGFNISLPEVMGSSWGKQGVSQNNLEKRTKLEKSHFLIENLLQSYNDWDGDVLA